MASEAPHAEETDVGTARGLASGPQQGVRLPRNPENRDGGIAPKAAGKAAIGCMTRIEHVSVDLARFLRFNGRHPDAGSPAAALD